MHTVRFVSWDISKVELVCTFSNVAHNEAWSRGATPNCFERRMKIAWSLNHLCRQSVTKERESSATFPE